ncbi:MAG: hypothetical protein O7E57_02305 [Gammaproteobacteria bacterium]|nr:hypothetical protein [Gammaproteobacteria bacterium]
MSEQTSVTVATIKSRPIGRILRFGMGAFMLALVVPEIIQASWRTNGLVVAVIAGLIAGYTAIHLAVWRLAPNLNRWLGAVIAVTPVALLFVFGGTIGQIASVAYVGGSLLIDSINGDAGCEVMAVPALLLKKRTHLACLLFSPLDWLEDKLFA